MIDVIPFQRDHLAHINAQDPLSQGIPDVALRMLEESPYSRTITKNGEPMCCGGIIVRWAGRGEFWGFFDFRCRGDYELLEQLLKTAKAVVLESDLRRVEAVVRRDFPPGHRLCQSLGMHLESDCLRSYGPDGADYAMYATVK